MEGNNMVTAKEAYEIMDKYISNNPKDRIMNFSETSDAFVFGTKCNPSFEKIRRICLCHAYNRLCRACRKQ